MFKFVILLSVLACALGAAIPAGMLPQLDGRIVGGTPTNIINYPWQVSLQRYGGHSCGATIYSENVVVTAAHCLQDVSASALSVRVGSTYANFDGSVHQVANFRNHEHYNGAIMINDIAVVRLASSISYDSTRRNIGLASSTPGNGAAAVVTGWGTIYFGGPGSNTLLYTDVNIVGRTECGSNYGYSSSQIRETMICAAAPGKDSCQGDSGGPLVSGGVLVGVVSWGAGCAEPSYPGVYADVAALRTWVVDNANWV